PFSRAMASSTASTSTGSAGAAGAGSSAGGETFGSSRPPSKITGAGVAGFGAAGAGDSALRPRMRSRIFENSPMAILLEGSCDSAAGTWKLHGGERKGPGGCRGLQSRLLAMPGGSARVLHRQLAVAHDVVALGHARHVLLRGGARGGRRVAV